MKYLPLIWSGIWRKRGRTVLIILQILVAFLLFGMLQGMKSGIDASIQKLHADLYVVQRAEGFQPLPIGLLSRIQQVPGIRSVTYQSILFGTYQKPTQQLAAIAGDLDSGLQTITGYEISPATLAAMKSTRDGAAVSNELMAKYKWKVGERIPLESAFMPMKDGSKQWTFNIVGTFDPGDQSLSKEFMLINYAYLDEARLNDRGTVASYFVRVTDPAQGAGISAKIDELTRNSSDETRTESLRDTAQASFQAIGDLNFLVRAIVAAVLAALLFSVGAMMMQSIRERTPELAVLKTLGFTDRGLFWIVIVETLCLCLGSALLGLGLAARILPMARNVTQLDVSLPASVLLAGLVLASILALISAAGPAWRALRLQVVDALAGR